MAVKCPKCGGEVVQATPEIAKCKKCGAAFKRKAPVAKGGVANSAPKQKKKGGGCLTAIIVVFLILIFLGVIGVMFGTDAPEKIENENSDSTEVQKKTDADDSSGDTFSIGETAELNDVQVTMTDYVESNGSEWNAPSDGNVFVLVEFEIANNSNEELAISSALSFEAYADDYALNYALNAMIDNSSQTQLDGSIAPGKKMRGWIGYEVPSDWNNLEIHFTDNVWSNNKFKFEIKK